MVLMGWLFNIYFQKYARENQLPFILLVEYPDGSTYQSRPGTPDFTLRIRRRWSLLMMMVLGNYGFITQYVKGRMDIEGDLRYLYFLTAMTGKGLAAEERHEDQMNPLLRLMNKWHMYWYEGRTRKQAIWNAEFHYGEPPEFWFPILGKTGGYTCGYWTNETRDVDEAEHNKYEHVCRKIHLDRPGLRIATVGGGFGYFELLAAEKYGAIIDSFEVVKSKNDWLRAEARRRGLGDRITVYEGEQRDVGMRKGMYDRFVSIGVYEHAGPHSQEAVIRAMAECLKPGGIGILHWIGKDIPQATAVYMHNYLYPGAMLAPLGKAVEHMGHNDLEILDIENLRRHYHHTLNGWLDNFLANWEEIKKINPKRYDQFFFRNFYAYLALCSSYFIVPGSVLRLWQVTFSKGDTTTYPMTREFIYDSTKAQEPLRGSKWQMITNDIIAQDPRRM